MMARVLISLPHDRMPRETHTKFDLKADEFQERATRSPKSLTRSERFPLQPACRTGKSQATRTNGCMMAPL